MTANIPYASRYNVYSMNSDGSDVRQLTDCYINGGGVSVCSTPSWSPDGTKIAFSDGDFIYGDNIGGAGIYIMNPDGTSITPVSQDSDAWSFFPKWSSDGKKILFLYSPDGVQGVYSIKPDGTGLNQIIESTRRYWPFGIDCSRCARFDQ